MAYQQTPLLCYLNWILLHTPKLTIIHLQDTVVQVSCKRLALSFRTLFPMLSSRQPLNVKKVEEGQGRQEIAEAHIDFLENSLDQIVRLTSHILD